MRRDYVHHHNKHHLIHKHKKHSSNNTLTLERSNSNLSDIGGVISAVRADDVLKRVGSLVRADMAAEAGGSGKHQLVATSDDLNVRPASPAEADLFGESARGSDIESGSFAAEDTPSAKMEGASARIALDCLSMDSDEEELGTAQMRYAAAGGSHSERETLYRLASISPSKHGESREKMICCKEASLTAENNEVLRSFKQKVSDTFLLCPRGVTCYCRKKARSRTCSCSPRRRSSSRRSSCW